MPSRIDGLTFAVDCPNCGYETERTFRWLRNHQEFTCPACGSCGRFDGDLFRGVNEQAAKLDQQLYSLGKSVFLAAHCDRDLLVR